VGELGGIGRSGDLAIEEPSGCFNRQLAQLLDGIMATATKNSTLKDAQNGSVRVEIFDQAYNLRGSDSEYILKLAEYVDSKMRAVAQATNTIDTVRLAVLAALNIADEYHLLKRKQDSGATDYQKRAHLLADALDEVLDETRKAG
jgi:cell division protein ZapA